LIEIINKQLLLQLVGYLCYWQMGFNSVFKGLNSYLDLVDKSTCPVYLKSQVFNFSKKPLGICVLEDRNRGASVIMSITFRLFW